MRAILLMAYGTPANINDVKRYFTHIRGGKEPKIEELDDLIRRYKAIGGISPLNKITEMQREGLEKRIKRSGHDMKVYLGMKHSTPFISEKIDEAYKDGVREILCITLAPHYSKMSVGSYVKAAEEAGKMYKDLNLKFVLSWNKNRYLIRAWVERIREKLYSNTHVIFTAHSLPERLIVEGDPYKKELMETSDLVASEAGISEWSFAFQSAGHTGEKWMGPDIIEHLEYLLRQGKRSFLVAPIGFVSDHLEILYDLDIECVKWAKENYVNFMRCRSLNDDPLLIEALYSIVKENNFL